MESVVLTSGPDATETGASAAPEPGAPGGRASTAHGGVHLRNRRAPGFGGVSAAGRPKEKVRANHLTFRYGDQVALDDVSVSIYEHRVTSFMGPSGCGKSTLLRVFNRMCDLYPDQHVEGEVLLDGVNILSKQVDISRLRSRVGMVHQAPAPFPMSIWENVAYGIRIYEKISGAALNDRVEAALRRAALWDEVKDQLKASGLGLSGGQQQRLCIARTIAVQPEVILMDEPCSALDPGSTERIEDTIDKLKVDHTVVIVTHNLQQAARVSDFAAFMFLGRLIEFGPTADVFQKPQDERTLRFVTGRAG